MPDPPAERDLLPLVIGVSGHRDLREADLPVLREQVRRLIDELRSECPHTPLWLLSPLAEGADRLVAEVALDCGARLIVPLPLPRTLYEQDFVTDASRAEFECLLKQATHCFEQPCTDEERSTGAIAQAGEPRDRRYAHAGALVALDSQLLIALWDGVRGGSQGGTWQVVEFMQDGVPEPFAPPTSALYDRETGPVYHILARRQGDPSPVDGTAGPKVIYPGEPEKAKQAEALQRRMRFTAEHFNRDALRLADRLAGERAESRRYLLDDAQAMASVPGVNELADRFALVDCLAIHFQRRTLRTLKILLTLSFAAIVLLQCYLAGVGSALVLLPLYALVVVFAFGYYWWTKWSRHENKYLDYRALAEGLRVQVFWRLAGLQHCVADYYLRRQRGVLEWVRNAIRAWTLIELSRAANSPVDAARLSSIQRHWVEDQADYFRRAAKRHRREANRLSWFGHALVIVGSGLAGLDAWLGPSRLLIVAAIVLPMAAALLCLYVNQRALNEHANQYERMGELFADAAKRLGERIAAGDLSGGQKLIFEIGQEALAENADWLILHRDRPLESPNVA